MNKTYINKISEKGVNEMSRILSIIAVVLIFGLGFVPSSQANSMVHRGFSTYHSTKLVGAIVKARDGVRLGQILDLVVDSNGHVDFAIVYELPPSYSSDWVDPWPDHTVAVPFSALTISKGKSQETQVVLNTGKEKFYEAPEVPSSFFHSVAWVNSQEVTKLDRYFGVRTNSVVHRGFSTYDSTKLVGATVKARDGLQLGRIYDLVVDSNGHVDFAIVYQPSPDPEDFFPDRFVVVPFSTLMISSAKSDKISVAFNSDKEKFYEGPEWGFKNLSNPKQAASVDRYYGIQPYWTGAARKADSHK
jgi:sporulation protein YlmC with PRC-barrel domain